MMYTFCVRSFKVGRMYHFDKRERETEREREIDKGKQSERERERCA